MNFIEELKRRNVVKVAIAYAVVSWIVLQIADTVFPALGLPEWAMTMLIVFTVIGFPFICLFAWAFELTPEGIKKTADVEASESIADRTGHKLKNFIIGALAVGLVLVILDAYVLPDFGEGEDTGNANLAVNTEPAEPSGRGDSLIMPGDTGLGDIAFSQGFANPDTSIAVLPFDDLSPEMDQEYFADGLTEELINKLSQVGGMLVTGRNSSFYFKGRDDDLRQIGALLDVSYILQGSVRKAGEQLRITAQLMDVNDNANLWSQTFDRQLDDVFAIQDEIAGAVATALSVTLRAGDFSQQGMTGNVAAYEAYMRGEKLRRDASNGQGSILDAITEYEQAVRLDPEFAVGWLTLAGAYGNGIANLPADQSSGFIARIETARDRARALAPDMQGLRFADVNNFTRITREYARAETVLQELMAESGGLNGVAAVLYSQLLWVTGRVKEGIIYAQQARRLDPLSVGISFMLTSMLMNNNRLDEALAEADRAEGLGAGAINRSGLIFITALTQNDGETAKAVLQAMPLQGPMARRVLTAWQSGGDEEAVEELRRVVAEGNLSQTGLVVGREFAAYFGEPELGLELLNQLGFTPGDIWLPLYSNIRQLPGFKDFVREQGLLDYWRETGNWSDFCRPLEGNDDFECF